MENLLFSTSVVLPVFFVMLIGYCIKRWKVLGESDFKAFSTVAFQIGIPAMLFVDVATGNVFQILNPKWILFLVVTIFCLFFLLWLCAETVIRPKASIGAFVQGSLRCNYIIFGATLVRNILGDGSAAKSAMVLAVVIPLYNVLSIIVLSARSNKVTTISGKGLLLDIVKNPMIIAICAGALFSFLQIELPPVLMNPIKSLAAIGSPIAMLAVGGALELKALQSRKMHLIFATVIKLAIAPLIAVPLGYLVGLRGDELLITMVLFAAPSATSGYVMATSMDGDSHLAAGIVVLSTLLSVFTLTLGVFLFRTIGLI